MKQTSSQRGAPRSKKSHEAILAAALNLAETGGPQALTTEAVARHAGVGKQTIYRWWPSRIELLIEVYDNYAPALQNLDTQRSLRDVLESLFDTYRNGPAGELLAAIIAHSRSSSTANEIFRNRFLGPRRDALANHLVLSGECKPDTAQSTAELIVAMIWYALLSTPEHLDSAYVEQIYAHVQGSSSVPSTGQHNYIIKEGYRSGFAGALITLHMNYFTGVWGFGRNFETLVTRDFGLLLDKYDAERDQLIRVESKNGETLGTLVIEASGYPQDVARVRFFTLATCAQGQGLGQKMFAQALETCRKRGQTKLFLTTFKGLDAARTLYERAGFTITEEFDNDDWGEGSQEVRYDLDLLQLS